MDKTMGNPTFGDFLNNEMRKRQMSAREFARFVDVSHGTIDRLLDHGIKEDVSRPSIDILVKIALKTNTDICYLLMLVAPEVTKTSTIKPEAMILAQRIQELPDPVREAIDDWISKNSK